MEGYTLKPGDTLEAGKIAVLVDNDGVGREISEDELREVLAGKPIRVDTRRLGVCLENRELPRHKRDEIEPYTIEPNIPSPGETGAANRRS